MRLEFLNYQPKVDQKKKLSSSNLENLFSSCVHLIVSATVSVDPRAEKFNILSNNHGRRHKCNFSVFDRKFLFWQIWSKKN